MANSFPESVSKELDKKFIVLGFKKKGQVLVKALGNEVTAFLGLGRQVIREGPVVIFPVVGVRFEDVYKVGQELGAYPDSKTNPTLSVALEYLVPADSRREYRFVEGDDSRSEFDRLVDDIQRHAVPFFYSLGTIDQAADEVRAGAIPRLSGTSEFVPLVSFLRNDYESAVQFANDRLVTMDPSRGSGKRYAAFLAKLSACASQPPNLHGSASRRRTS